MKKSKLAVSLILGAVATSLLIASCAFMFRACAPQPDCSSMESSSVSVSSTDTVDKEDCTHEHTKVVDSYEEPYCYIDGTHHTDNEVLTRECLECGVKFKEPVTGKEPHDTAGEEGRCSKCGWYDQSEKDENDTSSEAKPDPTPSVPSNDGNDNKPNTSTPSVDKQPTSSAPSTPPACQHTNTKLEYGNWVKTKVANATVCTQSVRTVKTVCVSCNKVLSSKDESALDSTHNYKNNICSDCGFVKAECKHSDTKIVKGKWDVKIVGTSSICYKQTRVNTKVCKDCGKELGTEKETETIKDHTIERGTCTECGFVETCSHKHTKKVVGDWEWEEVATASCCQEGTRVIWYICADCDEKVDKDIESKSDTSHDFDGRTCQDCGYKKPLSEGFGQADGEVPAPNNSWVTEDDGELPTPVK